jgi:hypothetical protein
MTQNNVSSRSWFLLEMLNAYVEEKTIKRKGITCDGVNTK